MDAKIRDQIVRHVTYKHTRISALVLGRLECTFIM